MTTPNAASFLFASAQDSGTGLGMFQRALLPQHGTHGKPLR
jgi:hypothetical protein